MAGLTDEITMPEPRNEWLTTEQVVERYHIDPRSQKYDRLKSKLVMGMAGSTHVQVRVWLKDAVEAYV